VEREPPPPPAKSPEPALTLRRLLAAEIAQGRLRVEQTAVGERLRIVGDGLFPSGSAAVSDRYFSLIKQIAGALEQLAGEIRVVGHTDNRPIRSLRYPSNWHLSRARAAAVASLLSLDLSAPDRVESDGVGDAEPIAGNDSPEGRAQNRRVEITLMNPLDNRAD
jgi:type VI secretion system protein ImpK